MSHRTSRLVLALALQAIVLRGQGAPPAATRPALEYLDSVVAKVNRTVITKSQVERELGSAAKKLSPADYDRAFRLKLLQMVAAAIEHDAVEKVGLVIPKRFIVEQIEQQKERKGAAEVLEGIKEQGYKSEEEYQEALGKDYAGKTYIAAQAGQYGSKAAQFRPDFWTEPTITEIRQYYRQHQDEFFQKHQARVYAILLPYREFDPKGSQTREERVREIAGEIKADLARGIEFAPLARKWSRGLNADDGGDLGWLDAGSSYQEEILSFALKGPVKELSDPILYPTKEAARGIAVVYVAERVEERTMPFNEAQSKIREQLRNERVEAARRKVLGKMLEEAYISPKDLKTELLRAYQQ